jgi:NAD+ synthase (glutamine-hydrolysing)
MRVAIAQINTTVGALSDNTNKILEAYKKGVEAGVDLVVVPELAITGYPPRDLLLKPLFIEQNLAEVARLAKQIGETGLIVGYVDRSQSSTGRPITNAVALLHQGQKVSARHKSLLPTYDVFDEDRYFEPASENTPIEFKGNRIGLTICEDAWNDPSFWPEPRYGRDPIGPLVSEQCDVLINIAASPWQLDKLGFRLEMFQNLVRNHQVPLIYCNAVGGNDELIFDGTSLALDKHANLVTRCASFEEDFQIVDLNQNETVPFIEAPDEEKVYHALVIGIRDYLHKCGFRSAVLGLSGGIDSAVTAALAVAALGKENVRGIAMPSQYSSQGSLDDAEKLALNLGIQYDVIPIKSAVETLTDSLSSVFSGTKEDTTEENIQARLRGVLLMGLSNKFGSLLLTTGNKSELAVGYCTLYGDMCGGLAAISDVPKTLVFRLARWINREKEIIPLNTIEKPPSAELRPDQKDEDSLPPYEILDAILHAYVVELKSTPEMIAEGLPEDAIKRVVSLIERNEYKRRQAAPGLKVTSKAFGVGRRVPIAQQFREAN